MAKDNITAIDSDHEIEAFLQEYIVEKVLEGYEEKSKELADLVNALQKDVDSVKGSSKTTNQNVDDLTTKSNELLGDVEELRDSVKDTTKKVDNAKDDIKKNIISEEKMRELLSSESATILDVFTPIQSELKNNFENVIDQLNLLDSDEGEIKQKCVEISSQIQDVNNVINEGTEQLLDVVQLLNQSKENTLNCKEKIFQNNGLIVQGITNINQKIKMLYIVIGIDTVIILGLLLAVLLK